MRCPKTGLLLPDVIVWDVLLHRFLVRPTCSSAVQDTGTPVTTHEIGIRVTSPWTESKIETPLTAKCACVRRSNRNNMSIQSANAFSNLTGHLLRSQYNFLSAPHPGADISHGVKKEGGLGQLMRYSRKFTGMAHYKPCHVWSCSEHSGILDLRVSSPCVVMGLVDRIECLRFFTCTDRHLMV